MDNVGLARRDDSNRLRDCTKEVYQIDADDIATNHEACMRVITTMSRYRGPDWDHMLQCYSYSIDHYCWLHLSPRQQHAADKG